MEQYIIALVAIIVAIFLIKKFVGCLVRSAITIALIIILIFIFYFYMQ